MLIERRGQKNVYSARYLAFHIDALSIGHVRWSIHDQR